VQQQWLADPDAERRLIAICLLYGDGMADARGVSEDAFTDTFYRQVWAAMCRVFDRGTKWSAVRVANELRKDGQPGAIDQLAEIRSTFVALAELPATLETVAGAWERRRKAADARQLLTVATQEPELEEVRREFSRVSTGWTVNYEGHEGTTHEVLQQLYPDYDAAKQGHPRPRGASTGLAALDALVGHLEYGSLCVIGGATSMGKTALALNLAAGIAQRHGWVLYHSLEMARRQAVARLVQARAMVTQDELTTAGTTTRDPGAVQGRIDAAFSALYELPIDWCDKRGLMAAELCARARKAKREHPNLAAWVVDYLQLIPVGGERGRTDAAKIGDNCRMLRDTAGEIGVPVILLSQLNRGVGRREKSKPVMSDLRDSGNIEEFADYVLLLYRPAYYGIEGAEDWDMRIDVAKNRVTGRTGEVRLELDNPRQRICSAAEAHRRYEYLADTPEGRHWWW
jgi:replicative DNA helicase